MKSANQRRCTQCAEMIDSTAPGNAQAISGWAVNRRSGGANMIALPQRYDEWLCRTCLDLRRLGKSWDQLSLDLG